MDFRSWFAARLEDVDLVNLGVLAFAILLGLGGVAAMSNGRASTVQARSMSLMKRTVARRAMTMVKTNGTMMVPKEGVGRTAKAPGTAENASHGTRAPQVGGACAR